MEERNPVEPDIDDEDDDEDDDKPIIAADDTGMIDQQAFINEVEERPR